MKTLPGSQILPIAPQKAKTAGASAKALQGNAPFASLVKTHATHGSVSKETSFEPRTALHTAARSLDDRKTTEIGSDRSNADRMETASDGHKRMTAIDHDADKLDLESPAPAVTTGSVAVPIQVVPKSAEAERKSGQETSGDHGEAGISTAQARSGKTARSPEALSKHEAQTPVAVGNGALGANTDSSSQAKSVAQSDPRSTSDIEPIAAARTTSASESHHVEPILQSSSELRSSTTAPATVIPDARQPIIKIADAAPSRALRPNADPKPTAESPPEGVARASAENTSNVNAQPTHGVKQADRAPKQAVPGTVVSEIAVTRITPIPADTAKVAETRNNPAVSDLQAANLDLPTKSVGSPARAPAKPVSGQMNQASALSANTDEEPVVMTTTAVSKDSPAASVPPVALGHEPAAVLPRDGREPGIAREEPSPANRSPRSAVVTTTTPSEPISVKHIDPVSVLAKGAEPAAMTVLTQTRTSTSTSTPTPTPTSTSTKIAFNAPVVETRTDAEIEAPALTAAPRPAADRLVGTTIPASVTTTGQMGAVTQPQPTTSDVTRHSSANALSRNEATIRAKGAEPKAPTASAISTNAEQPPLTAPAANGSLAPLGANAPSFATEITIAAARYTLPTASIAYAYEPQSMVEPEEPEAPSSKSSDAYGTKLKSIDMPMALPMARDPGSPESNQIPQAGGKPGESEKPSTESKLDPEPAAQSSKPSQTVSQPATAVAQTSSTPAAPTQTPSPAATVALSIAAEPSWRPSQVTIATQSSFDRTAEGPKTLSVQLNPGSLGVVTANLSMSGSTLKVHLSAESIEAHDRLKAETHTIEKAMHSLGYEVSEITITQSAVASTPTPKPESALSNGALPERNPQSSGSNYSTGGDRSARQNGDRNGQETSSVHGIHAPRTADASGGGVYI